MNTLKNFVVASAFVVGGYFAYSSVESYTKSSRAMLEYVQCRGNRRSYAMNEVRTGEKALQDERSYRFNREIPSLEDRLPVVEEGYDPCKYYDEISRDYAHRAHNEGNVAYLALFIAFGTLGASWLFSIYQKRDGKEKQIV